MKECDNFRGIKTYSDPSYIFSGGHDPRNPPPPPWSTPLPLWTLPPAHVLPCLTCSF